MKIALPILMLLAIGICIFNLFQVNWESPLSGKSSVAVIGVLALQVLFAPAYFSVVEKDRSKS